MMCRARGQTGSIARRFVAKKIGAGLMPLTIDLSPAPRGDGANDRPQFLSKIT